MHVLFVHRSFPAQFGHIGARLVQERGYECTFVSLTDPGEDAGIRKIQFQPAGNVAKETHPFAREFDDDIRHAVGIYEALRSLGSTVQPDLVIGHAGLGPTIFLRDLYPSAPVINYFEDFAKPERINLRPEWPRSEHEALHARAQSAMALLHLEDCTAGYSPTHFQRDLLPEAYGPKIRVIHDGIDTDFWRRRAGPDARFGSPRVVTYVSRAFDPLRGFDIFMRVAKKIYAAYPDVLFMVVGSDEPGYGNERRHMPEKTFREHVLNQEDYDLGRIRFLGWLPPESLVQILGMSDLHIYLTMPFALSWSLLNAMACGCIVLGSDTEPVREVIHDGENGLLRDFFDVDGLAAAALDILGDPSQYRQLGEAAERTISERYSLKVVVPQLASLFEEVVGV